VSLHRHYSPPVKKPKRTTASLLIELKKILALARKVKTPSVGERFFFPDELTRIPNIVSELQESVGKSEDRTPFWRCVKAVDHYYPSLGLIRTLEGLVKQVTRIEPGPLTRLLQRRENGLLATSEVQLFDKWSSETRKAEKAEYGEFDTPPSDVKDCNALLRPVLSSEVQLSITNAEKELPLLKGNVLNSMLGRLAFLEFSWERARWLEKYGPAMESFHFLVSALENKEFLAKRNRVAHGDTLDDAKVLARNVKRKNAKDRQKEFRKREKLKKTSPKSVMR